MDVACGLCGAFKFAGEPPGLCCLNDKVNLPLLTPQPEILHSMLRGETQESRHFIANMCIFKNAVAVFILLYSDYTLLKNMDFIQHSRYFC